MKTIILALAVVLSFLQSYGQQRQRPVHDRDYYLEKSQNLNTGGWILVTTGAVATTAGILVINNNQTGNDLSADFGGIFGGLALTTVGVVAVLGSIPLFVVGGHLKKKAARFSFNNQPIPLLRQNGFATGLQPALRLSINL